MNSSASPSSRCSCSSPCSSPRRSSSSCRPRHSADPRNSRTLYESYSVERGPILVAGEPIAYSQPSDDDYKFQRVYANGRSTPRHRLHPGQRRGGRARALAERLPQRAVVEPVLRAAQPADLRAGPDGGIRRRRHRPRAAAGRVGRPRRLHRRRHRDRALDRAHPRDGHEAHVRPEHAGGARHRRGAGDLRRRSLADPERPAVQPRDGRRPEPARLHVQARGRRGRARVGRLHPREHLPQPGDAHAARHRHGGAQLERRHLRRRRRRDARRPPCGSAATSRSPSSAWSSATPRSASRPRSSGSTTSSRPPTSPRSSLPSRPRRRADRAHRVRPGDEVRRRRCRWRWCRPRSRTAAS